MGTIFLIAESGLRAFAVQRLLEHSGLALGRREFPRTEAELERLAPKRRDLVLIDLESRHWSDVAALASRLWFASSVPSVVVASDKEIPRIMSKVAGAAVETLQRPFDRGDLLFAVKIAELKRQAAFSLRTVGSPLAFISYAQADNQAPCPSARYLDRFLRHLEKPVRDGLVRYWVDKDLKPGDPLDQKIQQALAAARVAVLLLSSNFLRSNYIMTRELPVLLARAQKQECRIIPVVLYPCDWTNAGVHVPGRRAPVRLGQFLGAPVAGPLATLSHHAQKKALDSLADLVASELRRPPVLPGAYAA